MAWECRTSLETDELRRNQSKEQHGECLQQDNETDKHLQRTVARLELTESRTHLAKPYKDTATKLHQEQDLAIESDSLVRGMLIVPRQLDGCKELGDSTNPVAVR
eukprot:1079073-Amphidinium_carterae.1